MIVFLLAGTILLLLVINVYLWKWGSVHDSQEPPTVLDKPIMEAAERKAVVKRLRRWRDEGKLSREEFEHVYALCQSEWNDPE